MKVRKTTVSITIETNQRNNLKIYTKKANFKDLDISRKYIFLITRLFCGLFRHVADQLDTFLIIWRH